MDFLRKEDIMKILGCKSDKALKVLRVANQSGFGIRIGKEYLIEEDRFYSFLKCFEGKQIVL